MSKPNSWASLTAGSPSIRREPITPVESPTTLSPPKKRQCSILMQRFSTTSSPAARARAADSGSAMPSCIQTTLRAERDRRVHHRRHVLGPAEDVHDLQRTALRRGGQVGRARDAEHLGAASG